jgi:hypothetical protein
LIAIDCEENQSQTSRSRSRDKSSSNDLVGGVQGRLFTHPATMRPQIGNSQVDAGWVVIELAQSIVAVETQQSAYAPGEMTVIDVPRRTHSTDGAAAILLELHPCELDFVDTVTQLKKEVPFAPVPQSFVQ